MVEHALAGPRETPIRRPRGWWRRALNAWLLLLPTLLVMLYAFVLPLLLFLRQSFNEFTRGRLVETFSWASYIRFLGDEYEHVVILETLRMAAIVTALALVIGYPLAYALWRLTSPRLQRWLGLIIFSPVLVSVVVRSYGWTVLLADQGPVNWILTRLALVAEPVALVFNSTGVILSMTHVFLPFVVFPIFSAMTRLDPSLHEAAMDLGAGWALTFRRVTLPLTLPGIVAGAQICFTLALGAFVTPAILGGGRVLALPIEVYNATTDINWPLAAVGGLLLLVMALVAVAVFNRLLKWSEV